MFKQGSLDAYQSYSAGEFRLSYCHVSFLYKIHPVSVSLWSLFCPKHILVHFKMSFMYLLYCDEFSWYSYSSSLMVLIWTGNMMALIEKCEIRCTLKCSVTWLIGLELQMIPKTAPLDTLWLSGPSKVRRSPRRTFTGKKAKELV